jgi:hypothetical protein
MDITLNEDAARRIITAYGVARDECQAPEFDDILIAIAAQHPGLAEEFSYLPWPKRGGRDIPGTIGEPVFKPSALKRAYTQEELDAAVMAERERCAKIAEAVGHANRPGAYTMCDVVAERIRAN